MTTESDPTRRRGRHAGRTGWHPTRRGHGVDVRADLRSRALIRPNDSADSARLFDALFADAATAAARAALHAHWRATGAFRGETLLDVIERAAREDPDAQLVIASDTHPVVTRVG